MWWRWCWYEKMMKRTMMSVVDAVGGVLKFWMMMMKL